MQRPYLIQRAKFENEPYADAKGIDRIIALDYMGSAEFEFGELPKSLRRIRENISQYVQFQYSFKKKPAKVVTVFCKKDQEAFVGDILEQLAEQKIRLKERCDLDKFVNDNTEFRNNDFWWDIDQDWMFWKFTPDFDLKFKNALINP